MDVDLSDPVSNCVSPNSSTEPNLLERPLSPVLNNSKLNKKSFYISRRRRNKNVKNDIQNTDTENLPSTSKDNQTQIENSQIEDNQSAYNRLKVIKKHEDQTKKLTDDLYEQFETSELKYAKEDTDFSKPHFKIPENPKAGEKKVKSQVYYNINDKETSKRLKEINKSAKVEFFTGSGKQIKISPDAIKKNAIIFENILPIETLNKNIDSSILLSKSSAQLDSIVDDYAINNKTDFLQTNITDTQFNLAADLALCALDKEIRSTTKLNQRKFNITSSNENNFFFKGFDNNKNELALLLKYKNMIDHLPKQIELCPKKNDQVKAELKSVKRCLSDEYLNFQKKIKLENVDCKPVFDSAKVLNSCQMAYKQSEKVQLEDSLLNSHEVIGFATASGKNIEVSQKAYKQAEKLLTEKSISNNNKLMIEETKEWNESEKFATVGRKNIQVSGKTDKQNEKLLKESFINQFESQNVVDDTSFGFATAGGNQIQVSNQSLQKAKFLLTEFTSALKENDPLLSFPVDIEITSKLPPKKFDNRMPIRNTGDLTASSSLKNEYSSLKNNFTTLTVNTKNTSDKLSTSNTDIVSNSHTSKYCQDKLGFFGTSSNRCDGFQTASGKNIQLTEEALNKANSFFKETSELFQNVETESIQKEEMKNSVTIEKTEQLKSFDKDSISFTTGGGKSIHISESALEKAKNVFSSVNESSSTKISFVTPSKIQENNNDSLISSTNVSSTPVNKTVKPVIQRVLKSGGLTKRLGMSMGKQVPVSSSSLKKAQMLFNEELTEQDMKFMSNSVLSSSTPIKDNAINKNVCDRKTNRTIFNDLNITPIKHFESFKGIPENNVLDLNIEDNEKLIFIKDDNKELHLNSLDYINTTYAELEAQLQLLLIKKQAIEMQKQTLQSENFNPDKRKFGVLYQTKQNISERISLKQFTSNPSYATCNTHQTVSKIINNILPSNAESIHFKNVGPPFKTRDGATIVPNSHNLIGIYEISAAFETMSSVECKLIPKKWIKNHFKWIVWKLASLERRFPDHFHGYLSIENIMQQLKYRYDKEINNAQRPALRKITEKDDVPQKRMVLCVANIIPIDGGLVDLELTDGWYGIQCTIDQPLIRQVASQKIVIGTKLITQCAEILNCDGCHALEISDLVRLKINYNCTRRAKWDSKLGYQSTTIPFPIKINTISSYGGLVGCIKVYVARVYPIFYLERLNNHNTVHRNKKAEEKKVQEWENQKLKVIETVQTKLQNEYKNQHRNLDKIKILSNNLCKISEITSPEILYQMLESTDDPEGLKSMLSSSQFESAVEYKLKFYGQHQQEVSNRISDELKKVKFPLRETCPVLKLRVTDLNTNSNKGYVLNVYKPTEEHMNSIIERSAFFVYNVVPKNNGELIANSRTHFKVTNNFDIKSNLQRMVTSISSLYLSDKFIFNEFDTVGTIVQVHIDDAFQNVWVTDFSGRLLSIRIYETPVNCCLLDSIVRGYHVAFINLVYSKSKDIYSYSIANQCSIITVFPQNSLLQKSLKNYTLTLPKDMDAALKVCDMQIESHSEEFKSKVLMKDESMYVQSASNVHSLLAEMLDDTFEDKTNISSQLTTTDIAMSLIDTDQYL